MNPLTLSTVFLLQPPITSMISWMTGVTGPPTWSSLVGGFLVMIGVFFVVKGSPGRNQSDARCSVHSSETFPSNVSFGNLVVASRSTDAFLSYQDNASILCDDIELAVMDTHRDDSHCEEKEEQPLLPHFTLSSSKEDFSAPNSNSSFPSGSGLIATASTVSVLLASESHS